MDSFLYKSNISLIITSDDVEPDIITNEINVIPSRSFKKGEKSIAKRSGSVITKLNNLWEISSNSTNLEEETISHHIFYLRSLLSSKIGTIKKYMADSRFEVVIWIWVETDNAGIGLDLSEDELRFLNTVSNRVHISFICNGIGTL